MMSARTLFIITLLVCFTLSAARLSLHDSPLFKATRQTERAEVAERAEKRDDICPTYSCVQPGGSCTSSATLDKICINNSTCMNDTCVADPKKGTVGSSCSSDDDCSIHSSCINNKCNLHYNPGTPCKIDSQCVYYSEGVQITSCSNGRCAGLNKGDSCRHDNSCLPPLTCGPNDTCITPQSAGSSCRDDDDCDRSLLCIHDTCASPLADGTACVLGEYFCKDTSSCTPTNIDGSMAKCIPILTQAAGAFCTDSGMCGEGLACLNGDSDNVTTCTKLDTSSSLKDCDLTAANPTSSCNAGETCACNGNTGKGTCSFETFGAHPPGNPVGLRKALLDTFNCGQKCQRTDIGCFTSKCATQYCKFIGLTYREPYRIFQYQTPSCAQDEIFSSDFTVAYGYLSCKISATGSAGMRVQFSLLLVLFALVVGLML